MKMCSPGEQNDWLTTNRDELFTELWAECLRAPPQAGFSSRLRARLERVEPEARSALVSRKHEGSAPLLLAAKNGSLEQVNYLLHVCHAPVDQRGLFNASGVGRAHVVTPLWAAAVVGHLSVVKALHEAGADIDAQSDSGSTPIRSACFMTRKAVVRYIIENGGDLCRPNYSGGTCLINAVQSASLCKILLEHNAPINAADLQGKTALHYAVQEIRIPTVDLLLSYGADLLKKSVNGDHALRVAALHAPNDVLTTLVERSEYSVMEKYDALLLAGATSVYDSDDHEAACDYWRQAVELRGDLSLPPFVPPAPPAALEPYEELTTLEDVEALEEDPDAVRIQALIITYRVLGPRNQNTVQRIVFTGVAYEEALCYTRCIPLLTWALQLKLQRDTILFGETCQLLCSFVRMLMVTKSATHEQMLKLTEMLTECLPEASILIQQRPQCRSQTESFDRTLRALTHLLHVQLETAADEQQRFEVMAQIYRLVKMKVQAVATGDSLLHLAVSRLNVLRIDINRNMDVFPSLLLSRALVKAGSSVRARNLARCSPLHVAALPLNTSQELIQILLSADGHLDTPNRFGESGASLCARASNSQLTPLRYTTLQCLAAIALLKVDPNVDSYPEHLHEFLWLHLP